MYNLPHYSVVGGVLGGGAGPDPSPTLNSNLLNTHTLGGARSGLTPPRGLCTVSGITDMSHVIVEGKASVSFSHDKPHPFYIEKEMLAVVSPSVAHVFMWRFSEVKR